MNPEDVIREYHESLSALKKREAEELAKLEGVSDADVRRAKAGVAIPQEMVDRYTRAVIALDAAQKDREERMIRAHEALALTRLTGQEVN